MRQPIINYKYDVNQIKFSLIVIVEVKLEIRQFFILDIQIWALSKTEYSWEYTINTITINGIIILKEKYLLKQLMQKKK